MDLEKLYSKDIANRVITIEKLLKSKIPSFGDIDYREMDLSYYKNELGKDIAWKVILNNCNQEQTRKVWLFLMFPEKYGYSKLTPLDKKKIERMLCRVDRIFLASLIAGNDIKNRLREIFTNKWLYDVCRMVERMPDNHLDLWPRGHFKSTIITKLGITQELLINDKLKIVVITFNVSFANEIMEFVKNTFQFNKKLKYLFDDILYQDAEKESPSGRWTNKNGIWLKNAIHQPEASLDYCSILKLNTGRHYNLRVYDDIIVADSVTSNATINKINQRITDSKNIGTMGDGAINREQFVGTRYHKNDSWQWMIDNKMVTPRVFTATHNGKLDGKPVFLSEEEWEEYKSGKKGDLYVISCQMLQKPVISETALFDIKTIKPYSYYKEMDIFIMVDPASGLQDNSDRTSIAVIGIDNHSKKYLLDGYADRMDLPTTYKKIKGLHQKWSDYLPSYGYGIYVGYEKFGKDRDIEWIKSIQQQDGYHFDIIKIGFGNKAKNKHERIARLVVDTKRGAFFVPNLVKRHGVYNTWKVVEENGLDILQLDEIPLKEQLELDYLMLNEFTVSRKVIPICKKDRNDEEYDFVLEFFEELESFPYGKHDDVLDSISRLYDLPNLIDKIGGVSNDYSNDKGYVY